MGLNNSLLKMNGTRHLGQEVPCFVLVYFVGRCKFARNADFTGALKPYVNTGFVLPQNTGQN